MGSGGVGVAVILRDTFGPPAPWRSGSLTTTKISGFRRLVGRVLPPRLPSGVSEGLGGHRPTSRAENGRLTSIGIGPNGLSGNESEGNRSRYPDIESRRSEARVHQVFGDHLPRLDQNEHSASGPRQAPQGPVRTSPFGVSSRGRGGLHDNLRRRRIGPGGRVGVRQGEAT